MDRRENTESYTYQKELEEERKQGNVEYNDYVDENGAKIRVPYKMVKEVTFNNVKKEELIDTEHAARLQYRLMLQEAVLFAKVEFVARKIHITYNPDTSANRKAKWSLQQAVDFLAGQGVHINPQEMEQHDVDYYKEHYSYHFNPATIREHPPYGYTRQEWQKMKAEYAAKKVEYEQGKLDKFHRFQANYLQEHPDLAAEMGVKIEPQKEDKSLLGKVLKKKPKKDEKGFWFHGV
ncbi:MAG: hypothetical protein M1286_02895 [Candidatus Marsarchaeota archaeon]|nr:hypothetical protein [Candidatus Marsarchaeota archaeon]